MDQRVKDVQQWLNKTYGGIKGFDKIPENGKTGWSTIYSLRKGLQHELNVSPLGQGFGDKTKEALTKVIGSIKPGYKGNIVKLIKGAFWCKGISPTNFTESFDLELTNAIKSLQEKAGVKSDGTISMKLMVALFDMSAFDLITSSGDSIIRGLQQYLNGKFSDDLGILPYDGIYQRATNTALIFALQKAIGIKDANGNYGDATVAATPTLNPGATGDTVRVIQYGLYVNGFYSGTFDGHFTKDVSEGIISFRKFMNLPPFSATADLTIIKGLLTSNGNTKRESIALDTSTQLSDKDIQNFKKTGFSIVGRYLTRTVGRGKDKRNKNLTLEEIKNIVSGGLSIFPIYEDGGYEESYFNASQGYQDAFIAANAARSLGFPKDTTIYFAVDVDIQDGDIDGTVGPYMMGVINGLNATEFSPGIYGTRNICLHGEKLGMKYSFVADMSYGWSGNLGFKMPKNWSFDQFVEYPIGGTPIDQVAASGKDSGTTKFEPRKIVTMTPQDALKVINTALKVVSLDFVKKVTLIKEPYLTLTSRYFL